MQSLYETGLAKEDRKRQYCWGNLLDCLICVDCSTDLVAIRYRRRRRCGRRFKGKPLIWRQISSAAGNLTGPMPSGLRAYCPLSFFCAFSFIEVFSNYIFILILSFSPALLGKFGLRRTELRALGTKNRRQGKLVLCSGRARFFFAMEGRAFSLQRQDALSLCGGRSRFFFAAAERGFSLRQEGAADLRLPRLPRLRGESPEVKAQK